MNQYPDIQGPLSMSEKWSMKYIFLTWMQWHWWAAVCCIKVLYLLNRHQEIFAKDIGASSIGYCIGTSTTAWNHNPKKKHCVPKSTHSLSYQTRPIKSKLSKPSHLHNLETNFSHLQHSYCFTQIQRAQHHFSYQTRVSINLTTKNQLSTTCIP